MFVVYNREVAQQYKNHTAHFFENLQQTWSFLAAASRMWFHANPDKKNSNLCTG
jgi:hypothetical protein